MSHLGASRYRHGACQEVGHEALQREVQTVDVNGVDQPQTALREREPSVCIHRSPGKHTGAITNTHLIGKRSLSWLRITHTKAFQRGLVRFNRFLTSLTGNATTETNFRAENAPEVLHTSSRGARERIFYSRVRKSKPPNCGHKEQRGTNLLQ